MRKLRSVLMLRNIVLALESLGKSMSSRRSAAFKTCGCRYGMRLSHGLPDLCNGNALIAESTKSSKSQELLPA